MSLPDEITSGHNPFAAPGIETAMVVERQKWNWPRVVGLLGAGLVFQILLTTLTIHFLRVRFLAFIETPYVHLICTVAATLLATTMLLRKSHFRTAFIGSQLMNIVQWGTFVLTAIFLKRVDFTTVSLSTSDGKIFFCIYLSAAAVIAIACWFVGRRRISKEIDVAA